MASKAHQFIANMISIKMRQLGYEVVAFDGKQIYLSDIKISTPPCIKRHRPDLLGYCSKRKRVCIGEAKTKKDLDSRRTSEQFEDYASIITKKDKSAYFVIGIPLSGLDKVNGILQGMGLKSHKNIEIVKIPDRLLPE